MSLVFCSWSGGKDCCLALYRAMKSGLEVRYLANTITEDGQRSCSHGISSAVIKAQSQALGIPIIQRRTTSDTYESVFIGMLRDFKRIMGSRDVADLCNYVTKWEFKTSIYDIIAVSKLIILAKD